MTQLSSHYDAKNDIKILLNGSDTSVVANDDLNDITSLSTSSPEPNSLVLNELLIDSSCAWQIFNCKITDKTLTQDEPLPFLYHYDALADEVKSEHPLTPALLKQFNTPMSTEEFANLLGNSQALVPTPWQVKVAGTLVVACEPLQLALRLKFTNTAKPLDPIYTQAQEDALKLAMADWHFYGDVFVLNKGTHPLVVHAGDTITDKDNWTAISQSDEYQVLGTPFALSILAVLEENKSALTQYDEAIMLRLF